MSTKMLDAFSTECNERQDIKLLPHNQELLKKIEDAMKQHRKIFYSEATGLGKSFIFMALLKKYFANSRVLYILPKLAIADNLRQYKEFSLVEDVVDFTTYAAFNNLDDIPDLVEKYDVVFVDECHHMLSDVQGKNVNIFANLVTQLKHGYVFGMTATPRVHGTYVDTELFPVSCYGLDSYEAMDNGLFPEIDLRIAVKEWEKIDPELREAFTVESTQILLSKVIAECSTITHWLAFFGSISELEEAEQEVKALLPDYKVFKMHSDVEDNTQVIRQFDSYNGKAVLLSVSMLLEGLHVTRCEGVLLYRNVTSALTYTQILGRICNVGAKHSPVFVDITNSISRVKWDSSVVASERKPANKEKGKREIFLQECQGYKVLNILDKINELRVHEYRGYRWTSMSDLSIQLEKSQGYVCQWLQNHSGETVEDCIDYVINNPVTNQVCMGYTFSSYSDLSRQLGKSDSFVASWMRYNSDKTLEDCIKYVLTHNKNERTIEGYTFTTLTDLSRQLGKYDDYARMWLKNNPDKTVADCIKRVVGTQYECLGFKYSSYPDLSVQLGKSTGFVTGWMYNHPGSSLEDCINYVISGEKPKRPVETRTVSGYTFTSLKDLAFQLNRSESYVYTWLQQHPGKTIEDCIEYTLTDKTQTIGGYTFSSMQDLSLQLGRCAPYVSQWLRLHPDKTIEDCIKSVPSRGVQTVCGYTFSTMKDLSLQLGMYSNFVTQWLRNHPDKTVEDCIKYVKEKQLQES